MMLSKNGPSAKFTKSEIERLYNSRFVNGNEVHLLRRARESFQTIFDSISAAEKIICLEFYIFRDDETGTELATLLKKKAAEGINIYILYDHFGSFETQRKFWRELRNAGINVRASHPFKWTSPLRYVHRDHKKLIIIDGVKAFTGGLNIANEYRGYYFKKHREGWRDTGIILEGPIALSLLNEFVKSWIIFGGDPIKSCISKQQFPAGNNTESKESEKVAALPIFASSARGRRKFRRLLYYSINHARQSMFFTTAYFTPSRRMVDTLTEAARRGVTVKLLLPFRGDITAAHYAGRSSFTKLLRRGVEIYNYEGNILHAKTAVFDGCWSIIGSANLDFQSLRWNDEGNVGILDEEFGQHMTDVFNEDLEHSVKIDLDQWIRRSTCEKIKEHFFVQFRKRL
ncbi:MAG: hypothetical protein HY755_09625 [Nitrospirae bacterium]|nr:hypothetical protein [Nitrospirota bacterium]